MTQRKQNMTATCPKNKLKLEFIFNPAGSWQINFKWSSHHVSCQSINQSINCLYTHVASSELKSLFKIRTSLWASSRGCSGGGAGKGRRACNYVSGIWICALTNRKRRCKMLIGRDDINNDTISLGMCFSMFVYTCTHFCFPLIGRNLTARSTGSHRGIGGGIQIPEKRHSCKAVRSPSFSCPFAKAPQRACLQAKYIPANIK